MTAVRPDEDEMRSEDEDHEPKGTRTRAGGPQVNKEGPNLLL